MERFVVANILVFDNFYIFILNLSGYLFIYLLLLLLLLLLLRTFVKLLLRDSYKNL